MLSFDVRELLGRPWALPCDPPRTFDCWALVVHARGLMGYTTPGAAYPADPWRDRAAAFDREKAGWTEQRRPTFGAVALLGSGPNDLQHCGVMVDAQNILHAYSTDGRTGAVRCDRLRRLALAYPYREFWQWH